ncbi:glucose 1-dehydrogenase [Chloroflexota bacterium]
MREGLVEGKVALVTGAGSGIGQASALKFMKEGAKVVVTDFDVKGGEETLRLIKKAGGKGIFIRADVTSKDDVEAMIKKAVETYGRLDCAHNNAGGTGSNKLMEDESEEELERNININLKGVWHSMKAEIAQMLKQGGGAIVNTASTSGLLGMRAASGYVATKHSVVGLTKAVALDYATRGIRVNSVCPGITNTPRVSSLKGVADQVIAMLSAIQPPNRLAEPEEVANAAVWLCSDEASFINGQSLAVDGGLTIEYMRLPLEATSTRTQGS